MRTLIVAPAWVGDMVMAHALVQRLTEAQVQVDMLAPPATAPLADRMPGVDRCHVLDVGHGQVGLGARWRLARALPRYDQAIVLPNTIKAALIPLFSGIGKRTGWVGETRYGLLNDIRKLDGDKYPLMIERFMALGEAPDAPLAQPYPQPRLLVDADNAIALRDRFKLSFDQPVAVLCPGAEFGPAKRWPEQHYAAVARHLIKGGHQVWLLGSPKDRAVCDEISRLCDHEALVVLAGETKLVDAVDLMGQACVVVCNDSGLMHVAAALEKKVVAVYGSTTPTFTPPLADNAQVVRLGLGCSPCFQRECPLGHLDCLNKLTPDRVIACL